MPRMFVSFWTMAVLLMCGPRAAAAEPPEGAPAQTAPTQRPANPHVPPAPDPVLLENPVEGPPPPMPAAEEVGEGEKAPGLARLDLALAFVRFERAFADAAPTGDELARANRTFDAATFAFFRGGRERALRDLDEGTLRLMGRSEDGAARRAATLRVRIEPPVWTYYADPAPAVVVRGLATAPGAGTVPEEPALKEDVPAVGALAVLLEPESGGAGAAVQVNLPDDAGANGGANGPATRVDLSGFVKSLKPGRYSVWLTGSNGLKWAAGWWTVSSAPRDAVRAGIEARLDAAEKSAPADAVALLRARAALLRDRPSEQNVSGFLIDQNRLEDELLAEVAALEKGEPETPGREGLRYAPYRSGGVTVPMWTFAPPGVMKSGAPVPLLIALHGAGAEESMFMAGYGAGVIREIAEKKGLIVASPLAYAFTANPAMLDDLIAALKRRYRIDESRVYLVGHSMGGIAASGLAQARAKTVAAATAIAGVRPFRAGEPTAPVLAYAAEIDRIIPAARVRRVAVEARAAGLAVDLREAANQGHTLVVGAVLEECVAWLLERRRGGN